MLMLLQKVDTLSLRTNDACERMAQSTSYCFHTSFLVVRWVLYARVEHAALPACQQR